jgi:hypothetical protein
MEDIVLEIHVADQRRSYRATFQGPDAEITALRFIETRWSTHAIHELEDQPIPQKYARLLDLLYPLCEHYLSLSNCCGPQHYYFGEDERGQNAAGYPLDPHWPRFDGSLFVDPSAAPVDA